MEKEKLTWPSMDLRTLYILKDGVRLSVYNYKVRRACNKLLQKIKPLKERADSYDLDEINTLTALSLLSEAYDQMGDISLSYDLIKSSAGVIKKQLSELLHSRVFVPDLAPSERDKKRRIIRQKIWCLMIKSHGDYRRGSYNEGLEALSICEHVIFNVLKDDNPDDPYKLRGTRARLFYFKGLILSEQGDWGKASICFQEAQILASERLADKVKIFEENEQNCLDAAKKLKPVLARTLTTEELREELIKKEVIYFRHCMGKLNCFGFARIQRSLDQLRLARHNLRIASLDLADTQESYMIDLVNLELGITLRALAGYSVRQLEEPVEKLDRCTTNFEKGSQKHYYIRSLIALGGTYLARSVAWRMMMKNGKEHHDDLLKAAQKAEEADDATEEHKEKYRSWRWRTKLLRSRIDLERARSFYDEQDYDRAEESLSEAEDRANDAIREANYKETEDTLNEAKPEADKAMDEAELVNSDNTEDPDNKDPQKKIEMRKGMIESKIALGEIYLERARIIKKRREYITGNHRRTKNNKRTGRPAHAPVNEMKEEPTNSLTKARDTFEEVKKMANHIPIYDAVCSLHLCRTYLVWNLYNDAKRELKNWKSYENKIENQTVRDMGKQVEGQLEKAVAEASGGPLIFTPGLTELNYHKLQGELLEWLIKQARMKLKKHKQSTSQANIAKELGLGSRTALYRWSEGKNKGKRVPRKNKTRS